MASHLTIPDDERRRRRRKKKKIKKGLPNRGGADLTFGVDSMTETAFETRAEVIKIDEELGLVFGWAIICTEKGEPYFDLQKDHIPDSTMLVSSTDFMKNSRAATEMHLRSDAGSVIFAFPLTAEIAKAFSIQTDRTGLMIAMAPDDEMLSKFKSEELTGFSIGGKRGIDRVVED